MCDLKTATTDELLDELGERHSACLFVGSKLVDDVESDDEELAIRYFGPSATCIGLGGIAVKHLQREILGSLVKLKREGD